MNKFNNNFSKITFVTQNQSVLPIPNFNEIILWIDTETTGLNPDKNNVFQLGLIITKGNKVIEIHDWKIKPHSSDYWDLNAAKVHKKTKEEVYNYPTAEKILPEIIQTFQKYKNAFIGGHNVHTFDRNMINAMFKKNNFSYILNHSCIDTKKIVQNLLPNQSAKLQTLCSIYNIPIENAHEALSDIYCTINLWCLIQLGYLGEFYKTIQEQTISYLEQKENIQKNLFEVKDFINNLSSSLSQNLLSQDKDIFYSKADVLINPVNLMGIMGKGLALAFKEKFPINYLKYKKACENNLLDIGKLHITTAIHNNTNQHIINFPTKRHWKDKSSLEDIQKGLYALKKFLLINPQIKTIAIPALGCGLGNLDWNIVKNEIITILSEVVKKNNLKIELYDPIL